MIKQKTRIEPITGEITGEKSTVMVCYMITRELDSGSKTLEKTLRTLKKEFGFQLDIDNYPIADL